MRGPVARPSPNPLVGTSGWTYASWRGTFYPKTLPSHQFLEYYAREFQTTEINYSFYHLPKPQTYANWVAQVPEDFQFSVKTSRLITHTKRLVRVDEVWEHFAHSARSLGTHLGPILLQFPPNFKMDRDRLERFLATVRSEVASHGHLRLVFEFRHPSWFVDEIYRLLKHHGATVCCADSPPYPRVDVLLADFAYFRFHGRTELFASRYSEAELRREAATMKQYLRDGIDLYVYFNNDARGNAVENARMLRSMLEG